MRHGIRSISFLHKQRRKEIKALHLRDILNQFYRLILLKTSFLILAFRTTPAVFVLFKYSQHCLDFPERQTRFFFISSCVFLWKVTSILNLKLADVGGLFWRTKFIQIKKYRIQHDPRRAFYLNVNY